jgi:hypothetical protein
MKKKNKAAFLANLKAMPDCDEKDKLLKSLEEEPDEDDDEEDEDADGSMEKSLDTTGLSKALDELERIQGKTPDVTAPLGARLEGTADLAKSIDGTGYLKSLIEHVAGHSDDLGAGVAEVSQQQAINNDAVLATGRLVLGLVKSFVDEHARLHEKLDRLTATAAGPVTPRTLTAAPMAKSFGAGGGGPTAPAALSKNQLANAMNAELKKSMDAGDTARAYQIQSSVGLLLAGRKDAVASEIEQSHLRKAQA